MHSKRCNFYVVTVPTPIGEGNRPDLEPLRQASETLGGVIKKGDVIVFESTVYPGCDRGILRAAPGEGLRARV